MADNESMAAHEPVEQSPPVRHYARVKRITWRDSHLLGRVCVVTRAPFRIGEGVVCCENCRALMQYGAWRESDNRCPLCGCGQTRAIGPGGSVAEGANPPVAYVQSAAWHGARRLLYAIAPVLAIVLLWLLASGINTYRTRGLGWQIDDSGYMAYITPQGAVMEGTHVLDHATYAFEDGHVLATGNPPLLTLGGKTYYFNEDMTLHKGWCVINNTYRYVDEQGLDPQKRLTVDSAGFHMLEGLGRCFVGLEGNPESGWLAHEGFLYYLDDGRPLDTAADAAMLGADGAFAADGHFEPRIAGMITLGDASYYLHADGALGTGWQIIDGYAYQFDAGDHTLMHSPETNELGALMPQVDTRIAVQGDHYLVRANTGRIHTGWAALDGYLCQYDADGRMRRQADTESGHFDGIGRFVPNAAGEVRLSNGDAYWLDASGAIQTGWKYVSGTMKLYDDPTGLLKTNQTVSTDAFINDAGVLLTRAATLVDLAEGMRCYVTETGALRTGWQSVDRKMLYFDPQTGLQREGIVRIDGADYALSGPGGMLVPPAEGLYTFAGSTYYLDAEGWVQTGWLALDGGFHHFDERTGMLVSTSEDDGIPPMHDQRGWVALDNRRFYVKPDGTNATGWQVIDGNAYCFDARGMLMTGEHRMDGVRYLFGDDGALKNTDPLRLQTEDGAVLIQPGGQIAGGWQIVEDVLQYYDAKTGKLIYEMPREDALPGIISLRDGRFLPDREGVLEVDGRDHYVDAQGQVLKGWRLTEAGLFYADADTAEMLEGDASPYGISGTFVKGRLLPDRARDQLLDGHVFRLDAQGYPYAGFFVEAERIRYYDEETFFLVESGSVALGSVPLEVVSGRCVPQERALITIGGDTYLLGTDGRLLYGWQAHAGVLRYFRADGTMAMDGYPPGADDRIGWLRQGAFVPAEAGAVTLDGQSYCMDADGHIRTGLQLVDGHLRYYDETGENVRGAQRMNLQGFFQPNQPGIHTLEGDAYYVDGQGVVSTGFFVDQGIAMRYADENGRLQSGFVVVDGVMRYFDEATYEMLVGFGGLADGNIYYADESGKIVTGWQTIGDAMYYFDAQGRMVFDDVVDGRYINPNGEAR